MKLEAPLCAALAVAMVFIGPFATLARAGSMTTQMVQQHAQLGAQSAARAHVHRTIDQPEVVRELARLGVDPAEAHRRIDALSDQQVSALRGQLDRIPAGGWVGAIVGAILIVFFVLLFTDLIGATDVFPWVNKR